MILTLEHLAPYLPYELKVEGQTRKEIFELGGIDGSVALLVGCGRVDLFDIKPILRPLSDISKKLFLNGNYEFVPSEKLANEYLHKSLWGENEIGLGILDSNNNMINLCFIGNEIVGECPFMIYQSLCEWHFDIFNLIGQGLAIDINTLPVNQMNNF
jgi:hypothetical protein